LVADQFWQGSNLNDDTGQGRRRLLTGGAATTSWQNGSAADGAADPRNTEQLARRSQHVRFRGFSAEQEAGQPGLRSW
jgi:hypothetical protein